MSILPPSAAAEITGIPDDHYVEPMNPVELETEIARTRLRIAKGIRVLHERRETQRAARRAYKRAYAFAFLAAPGAQYAKRYAAETAPQVMEAEDAMDVADGAFDYARDVGESLREDLSALQSNLKSAVAMYGATTGVGR